MARPRNIMPPVRSRKRAKYTELRVWCGGRWHTVGIKGDPPAKVQERVLAAISATPQPTMPEPDGLTIGSLFAAFLKSDAAPKDQGDRATIRRAGLLLSEFAAGRSGSLATWLNAARFEEWRDWLCKQKSSVYRGEMQGVVKLDKTISREYITKLLAKSRRVYRWAGKKGLVPASIAGELLSVGAMVPGRARRSTTPTPVTPGQVDDVLPHLPPVVRAMVLIQRATGARPSEVWRMKPREVHRGGMVPVGQTIVDLDSPAMGGCWLYVPTEHKTDAHGSSRAIPIPPSVQPVLSPFLERKPDAYCFSPAEQEQLQGLTPRTGKLRRRNHFDTASYTRSIRNACDRAKVPRWTGYQIRHLGIFEVAAKDGARAAQLFAGHKNLSMTSRYLAFDAATLFKAAAGR